LRTCQLRNDNISVGQRVELLFWSLTKSVVDQT
jgi:hypothetical protein